MLQASLDLLQYQQFCEQRNRGTCHWVGVSSATQPSNQSSMSAYRYDSPALQPQSVPTSRPCKLRLTPSVVFSFFSWERLSIWRPQANNVSFFHWGRKNIDNLPHILLSWNYRKTCVVVLHQRGHQLI